MGEARPQSVVSNEEHTPLNLPTRDRLGDVVQETNDEKPLASLFAHPGADLALCELPLYAPDSLEGVLEDVEVVEGSLPLTPGELELRHYTQ